MRGKLISRMVDAVGDGEAERVALQGGRRRVRQLLPPGPTTTAAAAAAGGLEAS